MLRIGGLVIFHGAFATGMADASARDYEATAMRDIATELRSDNAWLPSLLTVGSGLFHWPHFEPRSSSVLLSENSEKLLAQFLGLVGLEFNYQPPAAL